MTNSNNNDKLSSNEIRNLVIKTGIETIPYIGPSLSTAYFGYKQEARFKRIESFYKELSKQIDKLEEQLTIDVEDRENRDDIAFMIEQLNDEVERVSQSEKEQFFINFFISYMKENKNDNNSLLYFELLKELSYKDLMNIIDFQTNGSKQGIHIKDDRFKGSVNKLANYGLVKKESAVITPRHRHIAGMNLSDSFSQYDYRLSRLGFNFFSFCLYPMSSSSD